MKKFTLALGMLLCCAMAYAQTTLPCPTGFKRSNGAGGGCPIAKLTLTYAACPPGAPPIDSVYQSGVKIPATFDAGIIDCSGAKKVITYCVTSSNIAPTGFLTIYFHAFGSFDGATCVIPPDGGPLPVKMTSFYAKRIKSNVSLSWQTATELNTRSFVIQRKTAGDFVDVGTVAATNSESGASYRYMDVNSFKGSSQYRLKMVDFDEKTGSSEIRSVKGLDATADFSIFPNPSRGNATISVTDIIGPTDVQVIDNAGRVIKTIPMINTNTVEVKDLQKGMYMIRILNKDTGESATRKLTVIQ